MTSFLHMLYQSSELGCTESTGECILRKSETLIHFHPLPSGIRLSGSRLTCFFVISLSPSRIDCLNETATKLFKGHFP